MLLSLTQYAKLKGTTRQYVLQLIWSHRLKAKKIGNQYVISSNSKILKNKSRKELKNETTIC